MDAFKLHFLTRVLILPLSDDSRNLNDRGRDRERERERKEEEMFHSFSCETVRKMEKIGKRETKPSFSSFSSAEAGLSQLQIQ